MKSFFIWLLMPLKRFYDFEKLRSKFPKSLGKQDVETCPKCKGEGCDLCHRMGVVIASKEALERWR